MEDTLASEFGTLSINAMAGTDEGQAIKIRALLKNKAMLILLDSGSSHSFVSRNLLDKVGITPQPMTPRVVKVANGETLVTDSYVPKLEWWTQGHTLQHDMMVLDFGVYDAILGYDGLKAHSPMNCHWARRTVEFMDKGRRICLQGVEPSQMHLHEIKAEQLLKWAVGNEIGAFSIVETLEAIPEDKEIPPEIQAVLDQYQDVFDDPKTLPPERLLDHSIPLLPNATPVNSKPYRYSPLHKDEIEK
jgi:hypothetical protein